MRIFPATESGVDSFATNRFPGGGVQYGSAASGAGSNREIPAEEGGGLNRQTGRYVVFWDVFCKRD